MSKTPQKWDSDLVAGLQAQTQQRESQHRAALEATGYWQDVRSQANQVAPAVSSSPWWRRFSRRAGS